MVVTQENNPTVLSTSAFLAVVLRTGANEPKLAREPVSQPDLSELFAEAWRDGCLRKGHPDVPFAEAGLRLVPTLDGNSVIRCKGFALEVTPPGGQTTRRVFGIRSLSHVARRAAEPLIAGGTLRPGQEYYYELVLDHTRKPTLAPAPSKVPFAGALKSPSLTYLSVPLRPLLEKATAVNLVDDEVAPVFYTKEAYAKAERCSRRGAKELPPVESGGVLVGSLAACGDTGEFFCIVTDVLEVQEAEEKEFTLSYSSQSWTRLQTIMKARQAAHPERAERLVGQAHGHPFLPLNGKVCAECLKRPECSTRNTFASLSDEEWTAAVFARQPWALCHIFGLSARGDLHQQLHGWHEGRLQPRGFFLLPEFKPEQWQPKNARNAS